jgi:cytochrome P450/NADPH-cytochrome P450 reductase
LVNEVCDETRFGKYVAGPLWEVRAFAGDGLFTAQSWPAEKADPNWAKAHRILVPAFGPVSIQAMLPNMLDIGISILTNGADVQPSKCCSNGNALVNRRHLMSPT